MDRKFKVMGIYIGMLFCVTILLILVTSFSNSKLDPSYQIENEQDEYQVMFNQTMAESVTNLTETNEKLNERVKELTKEVEEKNQIIADIGKTDEDSLNLNEAMKQYILGNNSGAKEVFEKIAPEKLTEKDLELYNKLSLKLK